MNYYSGFLLGTIKYLINRAVTEYQEVRFCLYT
jgi:hypothetical protein